MDAGAGQAAPSETLGDPLEQLKRTFGEPIDPRELQPVRRGEVSYQVIADALRERVAKLSDGYKEN